MKKRIKKIALAAVVMVTLALSGVAFANHTVTICHATGSEDNPFQTLTISVEGLNGHSQHEGDIIPVPPGGCGDIVIE